MAHRREPFLLATQFMTSVLCHRVGDVVVIAFGRTEHRAVVTLDDKRGRTSFMRRVDQSLGQSSLRRQVPQLEQALALLLHPVEQAFENVLLDTATDQRRAEVTKRMLPDATQPQRKQTESAARDQRDETDQRGRLLRARIALPNESELGPRLFVTEGLPCGKQHPRLIEWIRLGRVMGEVLPCGAIAFENRDVVNRLDPKGVFAGDRRRRLNRCNRYDLGAVRQFEQSLASDLCGGRRRQCLCDARHYGIQRNGVRRNAARGNRAKRTSLTT